MIIIAQQHCKTILGFSLLISEEVFYVIVIQLFTSLMILTLIILYICIHSIIYFSLGF